jgi:hypothetical protein
MSDSLPDSTESTPAAAHDEMDQSLDDHGQHPLGPLVELAPDRSNLTRLIAVGVFVGSMAILGVARWIDPDTKGVGTHRQLGLRPCGFLITTGLPCPTCGMTTAFANTVRGRLWRAAQAQPAGTLLALLTAALACLALVVMITGRRLEINWYRINPMHVLIGGIAVFLGSWIFKIVTVLLAHRPPGTGA